MLLLKGAIFIKKQNKRSPSGMDIIGIADVNNDNVIRFYNLVLLKLVYDDTNCIQRLFPVTNTLSSVYNCQTLLRYTM